MILTRLVIEDQGTNIYSGTADIIDNGKRITIRFSDEDAVAMITALQYALANTVRLTPGWDETFRPKPEQELPLALGENSGQR